ncbi:23979_t:CDS:1 [Racocetra persica]|uniref:23979_t:CDS:1 n=1 Tax=Racocetra persica TaxID=160502 RepID=A0ACA9QMK2_9GLOM|nr:23979_t:CDS:1 [Racocetra persica]
MVNAQTWLDQNYPANSACIRVEDKENYGKTRDKIVNLDISQQNLESSLYLNISFSNLKKLNCSFNSLIKISLDFLQNLEEIDQSHNQIVGGDLQIPSFFNIKKLNFSYNQISGFALNIPSLTYLDATSNSLKMLDLHNSPNLIELKCSNNPIFNLSLTQSSNLVLFDCLGVRFDKNAMAPTPTSFPSSASTSLFPTMTIYINNSTFLGSTIGLGVYSGISTLCCS